MEIKKIGVLTGGGDAPGLNAVIRAVVKTAIRQYNLSVVGFLNGFGGLIKNEAIPLTENEVRGVLPKGGTILGTTNRDNPFHYPIYKGKEVVFVDMSDKILENLRERKIDALVVIGGDGSLSIAKELNEKGLRVIGVPKTIDNDLMATDQTFGFDTALTTATEALDKLHTTAEAHHRVMLLEVMGRYAGWIALEAGIAGGADVILIPEIPFDLEKILAKISERESNNKNFSIIVVAEGAKAIGGEMVIKKLVKDSFEPIRLGGIGEVLAEKIENALKKEARVTVLGYLQRGGGPTAFDRVLSTRYGESAVVSLMEGYCGHMVGLNGTNIVPVSLEIAVKEQRKVPLDHHLLRVARNLGICLGE